MAQKWTEQKIYSFWTTIFISHPPPHAFSGPAIIRSHTFCYIYVDNADLHVIFEILYFQHEARCSEHLE